MVKGFVAKHNKTYTKTIISGHFVIKRVVVHTLTNWFSSDYNKLK